MHLSWLVKLCIDWVLWLKILLYDDGLILDCRICSYLVYGLKISG